MISRLGSVPAKGGEPEKLDIEMWGFYNLTIHHGGTRLAFSSKGPTLREPDLWMMENFLPRKSPEK